MMERIACWDSGNSGNESGLTAYPGHSKWDFTNSVLNIFERISDVFLPSRMDQQGTVLVFRFHLGKYFLVLRFRRIFAHNATNGSLNDGCMPPLIPTIRALHVASLGSYKGDELPLATWDLTDVRVDYNYIQVIIHSM